MVSPPPPTYPPPNLPLYQTLPSLPSPDTIVDDDLLVTRYISVPNDLKGLSCAAFVAGIVKAILDGAQFVCIALPHPPGG